MKTAAFAIALLLGGAALAQTDTFAYDGDGLATLAFETEGTGTILAGDEPSSELAQPSTSAPARDARGIAVLSAPAVAPPGWNGIPADAAMGGPLVDPATGEPAAAADYPPCTRAVTDKCLQTYERGRD